MPKISLHNATVGLQAYYDEEQQLILYDKIYLQKKWDGLYFFKLYDPYVSGSGNSILELPKVSAPQV